MHSPSRLRRHTLWLRATNTVSRGTPGGGLQRQLRAPPWAELTVAAAVAGAGFVLGHPLLGSALAAGLLGATHLLAQRPRRRWQAGLAGELAAAQALRRVPDATVYHDVMLGKENADHVVVTPQGVFCIEVKHWAQVHVTARGVTTRGAARPAVLDQARRQAGKLRRALGVPVRPVLVFTVPGARVHVRTLSGVRLTALPGLPATLTALRRERQHPLTAAQVKDVLYRLDTLIKEHP